MAAAPGFRRITPTSNRLRKFEQSCGIDIFVRSADGMTPTAAGRLILERAARVSGEVEGLKDTVRELRGERRVTVRLAGTTVAGGAGVAMLPEAAAARFANEMPVQIVALDEAWAVRELRVCFADRGALSPHAERLLRYLGQDS